MDFFEHQEKARKRTGFLILCFSLAIISIVLSVYFVIIIVLAKNIIWKPDLFLGVLVVTAGVVVFGSLFKILQLLNGGASVAMHLGGQKVASVTRDPAERKLMNVVEEMAIASGVPVPEVYVLNEENGINAFAAGTSPENTVIGVTRGCIRNLTRDELQGVIAHEFSHILNGDMRMNLNLMGWIHGILCLALIGRVLLEIRSDNRKGSNPLPFIGLALLIIGWIGVFFGRLIKSAVSRQREFLADASAVQFTRNPNGIAGALKKIGGLSDGSKLATPAAEEASHLFFGNGLAESWFGLMATHPPLEERIKAIDPTFDGKIPTYTGGTPLGDETVRGFQSATPPMIQKTFHPSPSILSRVGTLSEKHLQYAAELKKSIPPELSETARESGGACALVYATLLSSDEKIRSLQMEHLATQIQEGLCRETARLSEKISVLEPRLRLPLVNLAISGLRCMSEKQYEEFKKVVDLLIASDGQIDLFEYTLQKILMRNLDSQFFPVKARAAQFYSLNSLRPDCGILISMLARSGNAEEKQMHDAFFLGMMSLGVSETEIEMVQCDLAEFDAALNKLSLASPAIKKSVLEACAKTVAMDGEIQEYEAELLRAIADTLDCPIPPFIEGL